ncbi:hypothetical protein CERZMDRAFT_100659 [Cercospora zeae-maydis SCOH1-5]|uniref:Transcription factor domain-containing protein n=1 Tax=Cercospora zeae-maydis SCOH1-5 TaxID=717836 RepID=A0A6A6F5M5_9PEZI|nr:hypothetical protein CERZMDRAFT_100659 [Cercospora zeae-maydis SCOH1-5]
MSDSSPRPAKKMRKGTRSCLECRKRKSLNGTVAWLQRTLPSGTSGRVGSGPSLHVATPDARDHHLSTTRVADGATRGSVDSSHSSNETGDAASPFGAEPAYLHSLFNNHVLSTADRAGEQHRLHPTTESRTPDAVEHYPVDLCSQVPSLDDVRVVVTSAADWWTIHNAVLSPLSVDSKQALIDAHPHHQTPVPSSAKTAAWLVYFAITLLQLPRNFDSTELSTIADPGRLVQRIFTHVNDFISADLPLQTRDGIECAIVLAKLSSYLGRPRKAWLLTRRAVTFAQLLNLDRARRRCTRARASNSTDSFKLRKLEANATVWESLTGLDRFLSLLLHLPVAAPSSLSQREQAAPRDAQNTLQHMMGEQAYIANRICYRDQLDSERDAEEETASIVEDLAKLEQTQSATWWNLDRSGIHDICTATPVLLQMTHRYMAIRAHLPYLFKAKDNAKFGNNALACMQACRDVLRRYFAVRTRLAEGVFLSRACEIQVFLACVVLLLHRDRSSEYLPPTDSWESDATLLNNTKIAISKAAAGASDSFTEMLVSALDQIEHCLEAVDGSRVVQLRVPLLGAISISRSAPESIPLEIPTVPFWAIPPTMSSETLGIDEAIWDWPRDMEALDDELAFWSVDTSFHGIPPT